MMFIFMALSHTAVYASMGGFSVDPIFPPNQVEGTTSFFDIYTEGVETQRISVEVTNSRDTELTVIIGLNAAMTNYNRILDYSNPDPDLTNPYAFSNIASFVDPVIAELDGVVTLQPDEVRIVYVDIDIPQGGFDGVILGAVRVLQHLTEEELAAGGMMVNRVAITTPVRLRGVNTDVDVVFNMGNIDAELVRGRANIIADISHPNPRLTLGVALSAHIYPVDGDTAIFGTEGLYVDFAPGSVFPLRFVDRAGFGLVAGYYRAVIRLEHNGIEWSFDEEFYLSPEVVQEVNMGAINQQQQQVAPQGFAAGGEQGDNMMMIIIIAVVAVLVLLLLVIVVVLLLRPKKVVVKEVVREVVVQPVTAAEQTPAPQPDVDTQANAGTDVSNE